MNVRIGELVIAAKMLRSRVAAHVAINAAMIDIDRPRFVERVLFTRDGHRSQQPEPSLAHFLGHTYHSLKCNVRVMTRFVIDRDLIDDHTRR